MEFNLTNPIAERKTKTVYRDGDNNKIIRRKLLEGRHIKRGINSIKSRRKHRFKNI